MLLRRNAAIACRKELLMLRKNWEEFKTFAFKGNMIDLAVAVVIGGAFGNIISAIVKDLIMPFIADITGLLNIPQDYQKWHVGNFMVGDLLSQIIQFLIIAASVFIVIVKLLGAVMKKASAPPPAGEPTSKECPLCLSVIPIKAKKCAHCTADLV
jgi:large conductance mechanosensitive channel